MKTVDEMTEAERITYLQDVALRLKTQATEVAEHANVVFWSHEERESSFHWSVIRNSLRELREMLSFCEARGVTGFDEKVVEEYADARTDADWARHAE